jgi:hypothetical protein
LPDEAFVVSEWSKDRAMRPEWTVMFSQFKREKCREYLGSNIRGVHSGPKILTAEVVQKLAVQNYEDRSKREPYFVLIARAYQYVQQLEWAMDTNQPCNFLTPEEHYALRVKS